MNDGPVTSPDPSLSGEVLGQTNTGPSLFSWVAEQDRQAARKALFVSRTLRLGNVREKERAYFLATAEALKVGASTMTDPRPTPQGSRHSETWAIQGIADTVDAFAGDKRADDASGNRKRSTQGDGDCGTDARIRRTTLKGSVGASSDRKRQGCNA